MTAAECVQSVAVTRPRVDTSLWPPRVMALEQKSSAVRQPAPRSSSWMAFFDSYIRDITHVWPLHPDTLKYLVIASGFTRVDVEYRSPVPDEDKLQPVPGDANALPRELVEAFNENVRKLNARMFTNLDYAVVAIR